MTGPLPAGFGLDGIAISLHLVHGLSWYDLSGRDFRRDNLSRPTHITRQTILATTTTALIPAAGTARILHGLGGLIRLLGAGGPYLGGSGTLPASATLIFPAVGAVLILVAVLTLVLTLILRLNTIRAGLTRATTTTPATLAIAILTVLIAAVVFIVLVFLSGTAFGLARFPLILFSTIIAGPTAPRTPASAVAIAGTFAELMGLVAASLTRTTPASTLAADFHSGGLAAQEAQKTGLGFIQNGYIDFVTPSAKAQQGFVNRFFDSFSLCFDLVVHQAVAP